VLTTTYHCTAKIHQIACPGLGEVASTKRLGNYRLRNLDWEGIEGYRSVIGVVVTRNAQPGLAAHGT
jgi:hypothetical protein